MKQEREMESQLGLFPNQPFQNLVSNTSRDLFAVSWYCFGYTCNRISPQVVISTMSRQETPGFSQSLN